MFHLGALESLTNNHIKTISKKEYDIFCKRFIFLKLQGKSFAESFCEYFDMNNCFLKNLSDQTAQDHIEKLGYIRC
jgi:hypothetical protein